ncbi:MAG: HAD hydrolase-like protein [Fimbriimonadaceae bacterium]
MARFKLAIFDLAGTTVSDSNTVGGCLQEALLAAGVAVTVDDVNVVMGIRKPIAIQMLLHQYGASGDVEAIDADFRGRMIETYRTSPEVREIPGTSATFRVLKELGIRIAVDTGFDRETTDILLERMAWGDLVDDSIASDEVQSGRPAPDMIFELCRRANVAPSEVIKVGDTPADLKEGAAAKVGLNVGVLYGTHTRAQLEAFWPDALLEEIGDLLRLDI